MKNKHYRNGVKVLFGSQASRIVKETWTAIFDGIGQAMVIYNTSTQQLAEDLRVSPRRLRLRLESLQQMGLLSIDGTRERYTITILEETQTTKLRSQVVPVSTKLRPQNKTQTTKLRPQVVPVSPKSSKEISQNNLCQEHPPPLGGGAQQDADNNSNNIDSNKRKKNQAPIKKNQAAIKKKTKKRKRHDIRFKKMSELLCQTIQDVDGPRYWKKVGKWELELRLLHDDDGIPVPMIWKTMQWYCAQRRSGSAAVPKCYSAAHFRGSWGWITEEMEKAQPVNVSKVDSVWRDAARDIMRSTSLGESRVNVGSLAALLQAVSVWQSDAARYVLKMVERQTRGERVVDVVNNVRPGVLASLLDTSSEGSGLSYDLGLDIVRLSESFERWNGDLKKYFPIRSLFLEFLQRRSKDVAGCWLLDPEIELLKQFVGKDIT